MAAEFMGFEDQIRLGLYYLAWLLEHDDVQLRGVSYVETFEGFSFRQALGLRNVLSGAQQKVRGGGWVGGWAGVHERRRPRTRLRLPAFLF
jgi:hypothetical protein